MFLDDRYELIEEIHTNTNLNSKVFKAYDLKLNKNVAIKLISITDFKKKIINIKNEALIMLKLKQIDIVKFQRIFNYKNKFYCIVMEYLSSITLKDKLSKTSLVGWSLDEFKFIFLKILDIFIDIHAKKIVHNDIKPENMIYFYDGTIKIIDFGISFFEEGNLLKVTQNGKIIGTPRYLAPEKIQKEEFISYQTDIYSLGIILFELATTLSPFLETNNLNVLKSHLKNEFINPKLINPNLSDDVFKLIIKATNKDLNKRYKSVKDLRDDFLKIKEVNIDNNKDNKKKKILEYNIYNIYKYNKKEQNFYNIRKVYIFFLFIFLFVFFIIFVLTFIFLGIILGWF